MVGGVCGGLGKYFGADPSLIRLAFLLIMLAGGSGFLLYLILWVVLPEEGRVYASAEEATRANAQEIANRARQFGQDVQAAVSGTPAPAAPAAPAATPEAPVSTGEAPQA
jgi:phage shock protein PspC (stress-responsive transcriptional regulator)